MSMINREQAIKIAETYLQKMNDAGPDEYWDWSNMTYEHKDTSSRAVLLLDHIIEKDYGWIFFYNSQKFLETNDIMDAFLGNAPFLVEKAGGAIVIFGTAYPL